MKNLSLFFIFVLLCVSSPAGAAAKARTVASAPHGCDSWRPSGRALTYQSVIKALAQLKSIGACTLQPADDSFGDDCGGTYAAFEVRSKHFNEADPHDGYIFLALELNHNDGDAWTNLQIDPSPREAWMSGNAVYLSHITSDVTKSKEVDFIQFEGSGSKVKIVDIGVAGEGALSCVHKPQPN